MRYSGQSSPLSAGLVGAGGAVYKQPYDTPHRDHYSNYIPGALTN